MRSAVDYPQAGLRLASVGSVLLIAGGGDGSPLSAAEFTRIVAAWQLWRACCAVLLRAFAPRLTPELA